MLFLLVHKAFMGFLRHVRLGIQQRALQDVIQGPCVIIDPSCQYSAVWVGEVVHVHAARGTSYPNSRQRWRRQDFCNGSKKAAKTQGWDCMHRSAAPRWRVERPRLSHTRYIGVLYYLAHCAASPVTSCPGDGSYKSTRLPDVYTPTQNHLF